MPAELPQQNKQIKNGRHGSSTTANRRDLEETRFPLISKTVATPGSHWHLSGRTWREIDMDTRTGEVMSKVEMQERIRADRCWSRRRWHRRAHEKA